MADIRWTDEAATWLEDIHSYIAQDNPGAAARVVSAFTTRCKSSRSSPRGGIGTAPSQREIFELSFMGITALRISSVEIRPLRYSAFSTAHPR
jgi:plasmid stabilization system protein ParE